MKLKVMDELGNEIGFKDITEVIVKIPCETGFFEKKFSTHGVEILSQDLGEFHVKLSPFEKSGLRVGHSQSFKMWVKTISGDKEVTFDGGLSVVLNNGIKEVVGE